MVGRLMLFGFIALAVCVTGLNAACSGPEFPTGKSTHTIEVGGISRTYNVYRPSGLSSPAPLVVVLHGGLGTADLVEQAYGWDEEANHGHFLVAYPNGPVVWNVGSGCCGIAGTSNVDDVGFITKVVAKLEKSLSIDPRRVYVTGFSQGGMMAYRLACQTRGVFAAIAPVSGTELAKCDKPSPVSIIHIHGTADPSVLYGGGTGAGTDRVNSPPIPSLIEQWRTIDDCGEARVTTSGIVVTSVAQCRDGRTVELISLEGIGHEWPGAAKNTQALDATQVIWTFFAEHPRPAPTR